LGSIAVKPVQVIKDHTRQDDHTDEIESRDMSEQDEPEGEGGGDPDKSRDADKLLKDTDEAPFVGPNQMDTEPVDQPLKRLNQNPIVDEEEE
jgi:hypothetical protein